jgi:hypothetical protein
MPWSLIAPLGSRRTLIRFGFGPGSRSTSPSASRATGLQMITLAATLCTTAAS